jgi:NADH:ubiquinone oxidoreductase subunit F (NADH-binding)
VRADQLPRLLHGTPGTPLTLDQHEATFATSFRAASLLDELGASGLTGRGGAAFPTARKARLLREQRGHHKVVVVNAMEGEPASHKDAALLATNPHLVLDGADVLASAIGARRVLVCVARDNVATVEHVRRAVTERETRRARAIETEVLTPPGRYVAGEESALLHWLNDNESLPQYRPQRPHVLRLDHHPVLLDNAETCAHAGLVGRFGADWFRSLGTAQSPGSTLVSLSGASARPTVLEVALGTPIRSILEAGGIRGARALIVGGYGGSWLDAAHLDAPFEHAALAAHGASPGAGVIVALSEQGCGVAETARVVSWMAHESARQCGPCAFGLPALAADLESLRHGRRDATDALGRLRRRCAAIAGRGACHHPDGVVRFVRSALEVFALDLAGHARGEVCEGARRGIHEATVPHLEDERELVWE